MSKRRKYTKICQFCGREYHPFNRLQKYCSPKCQKDLIHKDHLDRSIPKICKYCGKEFKPWNYLSKYCSKNCAYAARHTLKPKICPVCQEEFTPERRNRKYCSCKCSQKAQTGGRPAIAFPKKSQKGKHKYCDTLWSQVVKQQAKNSCEYCGKKEGLNSHHIFSRSNYALRWEPENGVCLCAGHHTLCNFSAHKAPLEFAEWLKEKRGIEWYEKLLFRAKTAKYDKSQLEGIKDHLKLQLAQESH